MEMRSRIPDQTHSGLGKTGAIHASGKLHADFASLRSARERRDRRDRWPTMDEKAFGSLTKDRGHGVNCIDTNSLKAPNQVSGTDSWLQAFTHEKAGAKPACRFSSKSFGNLIPR